MARLRIEVLRPLLKDPSFEVRTAVAAAIERLEGANDLNGILQTLKTGSMGERIAAIFALGEIGGEKVVAPLVYCAGRNEPDIRAAAIEVLGRLAVPSTLPVVVERLDDPNNAIRSRAICALANFQATPELFKRLRPFLAADDGALDADAALTLARLGDTESSGRITLLLASSHPFTRSAAATALSLLPLE